MAKLEKLSICGIRSFGPNEEEVVLFSSPLTLFQGQNGCGKTTIIEAIKYALTGELPFGSKSGQGFVNDPKMSNKQTTKGSVKVKITDAKGNQVVVARFVNVSQRVAGGLTFKNTLNSVRLIPANDPDNVQDIDGRCVDIDAFCAECLNISPAILNNVILCHQENSCWPLDENKKVKDKFDEIFDAVSYNKCSESLRKDMKAHKVKIQLCEKDLKHLRFQKETAENLRVKVANRKEKIAILDSKIVDFESKLNPIETRILEILGIEDAIFQLSTELKSKEAAVKSLKEQQKTIQHNISVLFEGTDNELEAKIESFKTDKDSELSLISQLEERKAQIDIKLKKINEEIQTFQQKLGKISEENRQSEQKEDELKQAINETQVKLSIEKLPHNGDYKTVLSTFKSEFNTVENKLKTLTQEKELEEQRLQNKIDEQRVVHTTSCQAISSKQQIVKQSNLKLQEISETLRQLQTSTSQIKQQETRLQQIEQTMKTLRESFNEDRKVALIEECTVEINNMERQLERLEDDLQLLQQNQVAEDRLHIEIQNKAVKESQIKDIKRKHEDVFSTIFDNKQIDDKTYKAHVVGVQEREGRQLSQLRAQAKDLQKKITTLETTCSLQQKKIKDTVNELETSRTEVNKLTNNKTYTDVLNETFVSKEKLQREKGQFTAAKVMYEMFISEFQKDKPCCPVCETNFNGKPSEIQQIMVKIRRKISILPAKITKVSTDLQNEETYYDKLQQMRTINDSIENISQVRLPILREEHAKSVVELEKLNEELEDVETDIQSREIINDLCKQVLPDSILLDQYQSDLEESSRLIQQLHSEIVEVPSGQKRDQVESMISELKSKLKSSKMLCDRTKTELDRYRVQIQRHLTSKQQLMENLATLNKTRQDKPAFEKQQNELKETVVTLNQEITELNQTVKRQKSDLEMFIKNRERIVVENKRLFERERAILHDYKIRISKVEDLIQIVNRFHDKNLPELLKQAEGNLKERTEGQQRLQNTITKILEAVLEKKQRIEREATDLRALKDNQLLRMKQKEELVVGEELEKLKKLIGTHNHTSLYTEKTGLLKVKNEVSEEMNAVRGERFEIERTVLELEADLAKPENKDAFKNYLQEAFKLEILRKMEDDVWRIILVLEKSIIQFHQQRMTQINKSIRGLWRSIYRGNDIDYIEIQTDCSTMSSKLKRSYNYNVVQVKKGVELEMRGRCSAGQKVLASLVIRMALAECFSSHCGIMALDEPTTNLDKENIESLSEALSKIISERSADENFQLLVITHDEEFLHKLHRVHGVSHYWRVRRNADSFSVIERMSL